MRFALTLAVTFIACLALPGAALAVAETEPNDGIHEAFGPVAADTDYDGAISSNEDVDTYIAYVSGAGVLDIGATNINDSNGCCGIGVHLYDRDGQELTSKSVSESTSEHITYTTPGAGYYFVAVASSDVPDRYRLRFTGPLTTGPRPGPVDETVPNSNPDITSAFGPLTGERLYGGSIDATSEEDWFYFYTPGPGSFEVALTNVEDGLGCCGVGVELYDTDGQSLTSETASENTVARIPFTAGGATRYFLRVGSSDTGDRYQFNITPAAMLTPTVPPSLTPACQQAKAQAEKLTGKLAKAKERVQSATTRKAKHKARKAVKRVKAKLKNANAAVAQTC